MTLPAPPKDLDRIDPVVETVEITGWMRLALRDRRHFRRDATGRFSAPSGQFAVTYLGERLDVCVVEALLRDRDWDQHPRPPLSESRLVQHVFAASASRPLHLASLHGAGLARLGLDARIAADAAYAVSQRWALALHDHARALDGIVYRSRFDNERLCAAIFDRAVRAGFAFEDRGALLHHPDFLDVLERYRIGLVD